jgi:hypothetical protein
MKPNRSYVIVAQQCVGPDGPCEWAVASDQTVDAIAERMARGWHQVTVFEVANIRDLYTGGVNA